MKLTANRCFRWLVPALFALAPCGLFAQGVTVTGNVSLVRSAKRARPGSTPVDAVVWLTPLDPAAGHRTGLTTPAHFRLIQRNKRFMPHIVVVPAGAVVDFPNEDPFFHNVFSLFNGKRFDLGLYEAGATRSVTFSTPGICYIFCNIHPEMSAVVVVVSTPYYATSGAAGDFAIRGVPPGRYQLNVWDERCLPEALKAASREVMLPDSSVSLGEISLPESASLLRGHKNLYGRDYEAKSGSDSTYDQP